VIRYKPRDWFELGLAISVMTFAGCVAHLFHDWRREKGDKLAGSGEKVEDHAKILNVKAQSEKLTVKYCKVI